MRRKKMAVIRGVRQSEGIFYNAFSDLNIKFIIHNPKEISYPGKLENLEFAWLPQNPLFLIDPVRWLKRDGFSYRSWLKVDRVRLRELLSDVDVVNISDTFYIWWHGVAKLVEEMKIPLVTVIWETLPNHPSTYIPPYCWAVKQVVKNSRRFLLKTSRAWRFTDSLGIPREKTRVVHQGLDLEMFHPIKKPRQEEIGILYVGQLAESKGVNELLAAGERLINEQGNIELIIAGRGPLEAKIKKWAEKKRANKYLGFVAYEQLPQVYQQADIYCLPSKDYRYLGLLPGGEERGAYTLLEAMASGLPVVATRCGSNEEIIGEGNPLVEQGNTDTLYRAIKALALNANKRQQLGRANRKRAEQMFELKRQARKMEEAILEVI